MMFLDGLEKGMMMAGLKVILFSCNAAVQFWNQQQEPCWLKQEFVWLFIYLFLPFLFCFILFCSNLWKLVLRSQDSLRNETRVADQPISFIGTVVGVVWSDSIVTERQ